jgi:hypothetical protein
MVSHPDRGLVAEPGGGTGGDAAIHEQDGSVSENDGCVRLNQGSVSIR